MTRRQLLIILNLSLLACVGFQRTAEAQSRIGGSETKTGAVASTDDMWGRGGSFEGFRPDQEVIDRRTKSAKHFRNTNGSFTVQTGGIYHYKDASGRWQDISLGVQPITSKPGYAYANESNECKSYFPAQPGTAPVLMTLGDATTFSWWNNPQLSFTVNGTTINVVAAQVTTGNITGKKVTYPMVYNGISEEFEILKNGIENNTIIHSLSPAISNLPGNAILEFSQFIPLGAGSTIDVNGQVKSSDFTASEFHINIPGSVTGIFFSPVIVFDNHLSKEDALLIAFGPQEKLGKELQQAKQNIYQCQYEIRFVNGGVQLTTKLPASWLQSPSRSFPVVIDPTVTITPPSSAGNFYGPMTNWYGYARHADVYLASEIGASNIIITDIEYNRTNTNGINAVRPVKIFMNTTAANTLTAGAAWNSATYTGGLTAAFDAPIDLHGTSTGWKMITLTNPFLYSSDNLLVMGYDAYASTGSAKYLNQGTTSVTARQAYKRQDNTDPGDATTLAVENRLTEIRLTYNSATACTGMPSAGIAAAPANVCPNANFTLSSTGFTSAGSITYQWESSPAGMAVWTPIGGATTANYTVAGGITTATDYHLIVTCTNGGLADISNIVSIGINPYYNCYCTPASTCVNEGIENVTFSTINNNSIFCATPTGYSDYGGLGSLATVVQSQVVTMSVTAHINSSPASAGVWIDYDHSQTFDASEYTSLGSVSVSIPSGGTTNIFTGNVTIDANALTGITRMRVRSANQGGITSTSSCINTGVYGEFEDYLITINTGNICSGTPSAGSISGPTTVCPNVNFTLNATGFTSGFTGFTYLWETYNTGTSTWDPASGTNNGPSYTAVGGISVPTDYRFVITCTNGGGTNASAPVTLGINSFQQCYCNPSGSSATYGVNNFSTAGGSVNISNLGSGTSPGGYGNFTSQILVAAPTDVIGFSASYLGSGYTYGFAIFIDYNQNGLFSDAGETVFNTTAYATSASGSFTIPSTVAAGSTRMRIVANYLSNTPTGQYCNTGITGEFEDYTLNIGAPPTCLAPTITATTNITTSSADINWTPSPSNPALGYDYYFSTTNTAPISTTTPTGSVSASTTTINFPGLSGSTTHYFWVRANCGGNDYSAWAGGSFMTLLTNDLPAGAVLITPNTGCGTYNNIGASFTTGEPPVSCRGTAITVGALVWFKFDAPPSGFVKVSTDGPATALDTKLGVFTTSNPTNPADLTAYSILGCDDDNGITYGTASTVFVSGLIPGTTYYIGVDHYNGAGTGNFCIRVDDVTTAMISPSGACSATGETPYSREDYTGWATIIDAQGRLIANARRLVPTGAATVYNYTASLNVNTGAVRQTPGSDYYLDRNFLLGYAQAAAATTFDLKLYFLNSELTALQNVNPNASLSNLNVTRQSGTTCAANYTVAGGTNTVLMQTGNGTANNVSWIQVNTPGFSNFYIMSGIFPLRIELESISATNLGRRNRVDWTTSAEEAGDYFELERSTDGEQFTKIGTVNAKGIGSMYSYVDEKPVTGINYYRIKLMDHAGSFAYSGTVNAIVKSGGVFTMEVFPNPVSDQLTVRLSGTTGTNAMLQVQDITGRAIRSIPLTGTNMVIDMSALPVGVYMVKYADDEHAHTQKITKR